MKKLFSFVISLSIVLTISGCSGKDKVMSPNGKLGYNVYYEIATDCYKEAAEACPKGYNILSETPYNWNTGFISKLIECK
jgi:uncharacterized protein YceK